MAAEYSVRTVRGSDAAAIARLCGQLGYPCVDEAIAGRLERFSSDPNACAFVADRGGDILGLVTVHLRYTLNHDAPIAQLSMLVVDESARRTGAGKRLVAAVEAWARDHGAKRVVVNTALHRAEAHQFYESLAFAHTGRRYMKDLPAI
ncbi:MAG TPA: GNAT family N-acetyltransferase [Gemmatimonadaceae bacterium]|nr:GNAT family N-acetyltransferase [Gemmatimonadaceae bacterium]